MLCSALGARRRAVQSSVSCLCEWDELSGSHLGWRRDYVDELPYTAVLPSKGHNIISSWPPHPPLPVPQTLRPHALQTTHWEEHTCTHCRWCGGRFMDWKVHVKKIDYCNNQRGGRKGRFGGRRRQVYNEFRQKKKGGVRANMKCRQKQSDWLTRRLNGWMKDKASADTQRTEAVNCTVEITGGEKTEGGREREWGG